MTELLWDGKYDSKGRKVAPPRIPLPFQTIETVNESAADRERMQDLFASGRPTEWRNRLIWGDKKYVLPSLLEEFARTVTLVYVDPPFNTGGNFSFTATIPASDNEEDDTSFVKEPSLIEQKAYRDTWGVAPEDRARGVGQLDRYLRWSYETVPFLWQLLAEDGSLYVHMDWKMGHYVKALLDEVAGPEHFISEIVWQRSTAHNNPERYGPIHDLIFYYAKSEAPVWNYQYTDYDPSYLTEHFTNQNEEGRLYRINEVTGSGLRAGDSGKSWRGHDPSKKGRHWAIPRILQEKLQLSGSTQEMLDQLDARGYIEWGKGEGNWPRLRYFKDDMRGVVLQDIWTDVYRQSVTPYPTEKPEALLERIVKASSNEGQLVLDCFVGSGTTAAVAEKLNRRWIACDLGRFAIHTTRKRLLGIPGVKPFVVQNLGKYERQAWQVAEFGEGAQAATEAYRRFVLELYHAQPVTGYLWLHGSKSGRMVHVGSVDAPVTRADVSGIVTEFRKAVGRGKDAPQRSGIDVLGWDFAFELNETSRQEAELAGINLRLIRIPREVLEKQAVEQGDIKFFELAALAVSVKRRARTVTVELTDFIIPLDDVPEDVQKAVTHWEQWIDYWAVDWNNSDDTFHNEWQTYRTRKDKNLARQTSHTYPEPGKYQVLIKVIDILGNDTTKLLQVEVK